MWNSWCSTLDCLSLVVLCPLLSWTSLSLFDSLVSRVLCLSSLSSFSRLSRLSLSLFSLLLYLSSLSRLYLSSLSLSLLSLSWPISGISGPLLLSLLAPFRTKKNKKTRKKNNKSRPHDWLYIIAMSEIDVAFKHLEETAPLFARARFFTLSGSWSLSLSLSLFISICCLISHFSSFLFYYIHLPNDLDWKIASHYGVATWKTIYIYI